MFECRLCTQAVVMTSLIGSVTGHPEFTHIRSSASRFHQTTKLDLSSI